MTALARLSSAQLSTLKRTIARDLNALEFDLFMEASRSYGLDPFRRQIIPAIYHKDDPKRRSMTLITTRDGLRVIASRQGNYRPASDAPVVTQHPEGWKHPGQGLPPNPLAIEKVSTQLWRREGNEWFPVYGEAYWDEYAPRGGAWAKSQWPKMPRVMITKCAEAAALRAGWPDAFAGLYVPEEMAQADGWTSLESASEMLAKAETQRRQEMIGDGILFDMDGTRLEPVPVGDVFDRICEAMEKMSDDEVFRFRARNEHGLRQYWAAQPGDALQLKRIMEPRADRAMEAAAKESTK